MDARLNVFRIEDSVEKGRPVLDFTHPIHWQIDWEPLTEVLEGRRKVRDYCPLEFYVFPTVSQGWDANIDPRAAEWDCYGVAGTSGLLSYRALQLIGVSCFGNFELIPARVNDADYRFL